jgi:hypothetical protein
MTTLKSKLEAEKERLIDEHCEDEDDIIRNNARVCQIEADIEILKSHLKEQIDGCNSDKIFHDHIKAHFEKEHPDWKVVCKICNKPYDEIVKDKCKFISKEIGLV